jgi:hypothetical protein
MSWDASLYRAKDGVMAVDEAGEALWCFAGWNYTHNTNGMIAAAYEAATGEATEQCGGPLGPVIGAAWWKRLDGASGESGAAYLSQVIEGLTGDPDRFRAMSPENGWGDYDGLLRVLREMRDLPDLIGAETVWSVSG